MSWVFVVRKVLGMGVPVNLNIDKSAQILSLVVEVESGVLRAVLYVLTANKVDKQEKRIVRSYLENEGFPREIIRNFLGTVVLEDNTWHVFETYE